MDEDLRIRPKRKVHFISSFIFISIHKESSLQFFSSVKKFPPSLSHLSLRSKLKINKLQFGYFAWGILFSLMFS